MLAVNIKEGKLYLNDEVKQAVVSKRPYEKLLKDSVLKLAKGSFKPGENSRSYGKGLPLM